MGKFMRVLERAGLVSLEEGDAGSSLPDVELPPAEPVAESPAPALSEAETRIEEQQSFESIYGAQGVPPCPFPAEKLLRVFDGLKALEPATRKAAITAMDAADDAWSISDPVLDAQRKIGALNAQIALLASQAQAAQVYAEEKAKAADERCQQSTSVIRQQMAELEQLLTRETEKAATEKAQQEAGTQATQAACARETARLQSEATRLSELISQFAAT